MILIYRFHRAIDIRKFFKEEQVVAILDSDGSLATVNFHEYISYTLVTKLAFKNAKIGILNYLF